MVKIIDGKKLSIEIKDSVKKLIEEYGKKPKLVVIQVGGNSASSTYVKNKEKACEYCGIEVTTQHLLEDTSEEHLLTLIDMLNVSDRVNGILVQLPLPKHIDEQKVLNTISPIKDVDGFHPMNVAKLWTNDKTTILPCTPKGIIKLIKTEYSNLIGLKATVIGRSNIVGKPVAKLLMDEGCTVTICHSKTGAEDLIDSCQHADILVAAVGKESFVKWCGFKTTIIDVGINRNSEGKLCGDVDPSLYKYCRAYTPVPGGVGPMTIACLMENTFECMKLQDSLKSE